MKKGYFGQKAGNRLLAQRKALGLTQAEVAERAGLSDRTYADIERGRHAGNGSLGKIRFFGCIFREDVIE